MSFQKKVMVFIDGTNFQTELVKILGFKSIPDKNPPLSLFEFSNELVRHHVNNISTLKNCTHIDYIRNYWFASYKNLNEIKTRLNLESALNQSNFEPYLFQKEKNNKEKGVDIALSIEMLTNSINKNFDVAVLIAGDKDYCGLVKECKRYGIQVFGMFFENGLSHELNISFDEFLNLEPFFGDTSETLGKVTDLSLKLKDELKSIYQPL